MKVICIRDDDTNFFTTYEELKEGYGEFWGKIPVTLATVPFVHGSERRIIEVEKPAERKFMNLREWEMNASLTELNEYYKVHPIGENESLVESLKPMIKAKEIEIAQHGVEHRYNEFGPEMYKDNIGFETIRAGREYLNKVFQTDVKIFIPPSNTIDSTCARYVNGLGMDLLTCGGLNYRTRRERILETCRYPGDILRTLNCRMFNKSPLVRKRKGINIFSAITFNQLDAVDDVHEKILKILEQNGAVCITTHYRLLGELDNSHIAYRKKWHRLLGRLSCIDNVEFVRASDYVDNIKERFF